MNSRATMTMSVIIIVVICSGNIIINIVGINQKCNTFYCNPNKNKLQLY